MNSNTINFVFLGLDVGNENQVASSGGPTVKLSQYADHLLKALLKHIQSYVH